MIVLLHGDGNQKIGETLPPIFAMLSKDTSRLTLHQRHRHQRGLRMLIGMTCSLSYLMRHIFQMRETTSLRSIYKTEEKGFAGEQQIGDGTQRKMS